jgi:hypothetical protein
VDRAAGLVGLKSRKLSNLDTVFMHVSLSRTWTGHGCKSQMNTIAVNEEEEEDVIEEEEEEEGVLTNNE